MVRSHQHPAENVIGHGVGQKLPAYIAAAEDRLINR
jgi:hypothetical protein